MANNITMYKNINLKSLMRARVERLVGLIRFSKIILFLKKANKQKVNRNLSLKIYLFTIY
jgi:hypothetical protein